jgi:hypothetical protein
VTNPRISAVLVQLRVEKASQEDACVARMAEWMGLRVVVVENMVDALRELRALSREGDGPVPLALSGATALRLCSSPETLSRRWLVELRELARFFIYGFPRVGGTEVLGHVLPQERGEPLVCLPPGPMSYEFGAAAEAPLAGQAFTSKAPEAVTVFPRRESLNGAAVLMAVNGQPLLISHGCSGATDYFLSQAPRTGLDTELTPTQYGGDYHGEVLPTALALRQMFKTSCWHNPFPGACVIIDDPLLQRRYGWFDYDDVLAELVAKEYTMTVAFIPCNYSRSDPQVVAQVARHTELLSICVHGCDHTRREFGETNAPSIESKAAAGLANMERHKKLTGLGFDSVMVFPQGVYSSCALSALKHCGYLAAVNTEACPTDHATAPMALADVFDLANTRYDSFPLFSRQYPQEVFDFAVDLFWGKPLLVVEHQQYFRNGAGCTTEFVQQLRKLEPRLEWVTLEKALIGAGHYRRTGPGSYAVKFVTPIFRLRNPLSQRAQFDCRKLESEPERIQNVFVDAEAVSFRMEENRVCLEMDLEPGQERIIRLQYKPYQACRIPRSPRYRAAAFVWRRLREFRDNHVARNDRLLGLYKTLKRWLQA